MNRRILTGATLAGAVVSSALLGSRFNPGRGETREWYDNLDKPSFNPPDGVFPAVWSALYTLMAISAYRAATRGDGRGRALSLGLWGTQLALNAAWSPLFFGAKKPGWALVDLAALLGAIAAYTTVVRRVDAKASLMMAPYLAWVAFAGVLNAEIVRRNA